MLGSEKFICGINPEYNTERQGEFKDLERRARWSMLSEIESQEEIKR